MAARATKLRLRITSVCVVFDEEHGTFTASRPGHPVGCTSRLASMAVRELASHLDLDPIDVVYNGFNAEASIPHQQWNIVEINR